MASSSGNKTESQKYYYFPRVRHSKKKNSLILTSVCEAHVIFLTFILSRIVKIRFRENVYVNLKANIHIPIIDCLIFFSNQDFNYRTDFGTFILFSQ